MTWVMDETNVDSPNVLPEMSTGVPLMMFPTTAAGTGNGYDHQTSNPVLQDATVDYVSAWITINDCVYLISVLILINGRI